MWFSMTKLLDLSSFKKIFYFKFLGFTVHLTATEFPAQFWLLNFIQTEMNSMLFKLNKHTTKK